MIQKYITCGIMVLTMMGCSISKNLQDYTLPFDAYHYESNKVVRGAHAAVVSAHPLASRVGMEIMKLGGNAMDAAIATQLALAVVYPGAGNIGGGGFMVATMADGKQLAIDFRERAPMLASRDMYLDSAGNVLNALSKDGHLAAGVPGTVDGLFEMSKYGKLPFKSLIQPAIELAEKGFAISAMEAANLNWARAGFLANNTVIPVFVKNTPWKQGDTLVQKDLAETLKRIRDKGAKGFYGGTTARMIVDEMQRGKGIITKKDLRLYKAVRRDVVSFPYKGYQVITMPLPSSGGILLPQMLKMVEQHSAEMKGFHDPTTVQLMTEVERRAFEDRAQYLGDPDFVEVPVNKLTSEAYLHERMKDYVPGKAGKSKPFSLPAKESTETTHISIYDSEGNAVSVTTTLNGSYGSRTVVSGAGFLLNNEMDDFSVKPGVPNMYGALGTEANAISAGKRMLSSMTPTIVLKQGKPFMVVGTPGGTTIPTSVFQSILNVIDFGLSAEEAVNRPKFHHQWFPDQLMLEKGFPENVKKALLAMGYKFMQVNQIGRTEMIQVQPDGTIEAVGDNRGDDAAESF